jgi:capsular exopolysaccharide synthesis family protein
MSAYLAKRVRLDSIRRDRISIEAVLRSGESTGSVSVDAFHTIGATKQAPDLVTVLGEVSKTEAELRALRARYTDEYIGIKTVQAQLDQLTRQTVPSYAARLVDQLRAQETKLRTEIDQDSLDLRQIPTRTHTEEKLAREAQAAIRLSQELANRLQENRLAELTQTPDVRVLDRAEIPDTPSSNSAPRVILLGVAASIGLALGLAVLLDRLDPRFRYPEQISQGLGMSILGAVPAIRTGRSAVLSPTETAQVVEAFRTIRLNIAHAFPDNSPIVLTITSPAAGDGKSLIAANLAMSFADAGYRTLLIDGDTRRGTLHRIFGIERIPGLLDRLLGTAGLDEVVRTPPDSRLTLIPSGKRTSRGPELLGSAAMTDLIQEVTGRYQVVLIDSPPLGAGIDPFVLSTVAGQVVLVVRAGETDRELTEAKLQLLDRMPTRILGAILNHIDPGSSSYRYYVYDYNYHVEEERSEPADRPSVSLPKY